METTSLPLQERERGFKLLLTSSGWNAAGFNLLTQMIITLVALQFNPTNLQLGYIAAAPQIVGVVLLFIPWLFSGMYARKLYFSSWLLRGLVCLGYAGLFFLSGQWAVRLILVVFTLFNLLRIVGVSVAQSVQGAIFQGSDMGSNMLKVGFIAAFAGLGSKLISFFMLSTPLFSGLEGLLGIVFFGVVLNTVASLPLRAIPCREYIRSGGDHSILKMLRTSLSDPARRNPLLLQWLYSAAFVLFGFITPYLRNSVGLDNNLVMLYSIMGSLAGIVANLFLRPYIDRLGSKPLLILIFGLGNLVTLVWMLLPGTLPLAVYLAMGFLQGMVMFMAFNVNRRLFYRSMPETGKAAFTAMNNFVIAVIGLLMSFVSGKLADFGEIVTLPGGHRYSWVFALAAVLMAVMILVTGRTRDAGALSVKRTLGIFFNNESRRALYWIYQLGTSSDSRKRETTLMSLEQNPSSLVTAEMRRLLKSPLSWEKERALRSLFSYPRPELIDAIIDEASDTHSYNRQDAIFALGAYHDKRVRRFLRSLMQESDIITVSNALKSLSRIDDAIPAAEYRAMLVRAEVRALPKAFMNVFIGLTGRDTEGFYLRELSRLMSPELGIRQRQLGYVLVARRMEMQPPLSDFLTEENLKTGRGLRRLLPECRDLVPFYADRRRLLQITDAGDWEAVLLWCRDVLNRREREAIRYRNLRDGLLTFDSHGMDITAALAVLYFTYQYARE